MLQYAWYFEAWVLFCVFLVFVCVIVDVDADVERDTLPEQWSYSFIQFIQEIRAASKLR